MNLFSFSRALRFGALLLFGSASAFCSTITVDPTVTASEGLFHYAYSVSFTGTDDAFLIDISVPADPTAVANIMTPAGFTSQFDSVNGLLSFLENGSFFTATPTSGFTFDSDLAPGTALVNASVADIDGNISNVTGSTLAPSLAAVPEPSSLLLLTFLVPGFLILRRRNTKSTQPLETSHV